MYFVLLFLINNLNKLLLIYKSIKKIKEKPKIPDSAKISR